MITFSKLGRYGAIGNQLFQYATLYAIAKKNNYTVKIPYNVKEYFLVEANRTFFYFKNAFKNILAEELTKEDEKNILHNVSWIKSYFNPNIFNIPDFSNLEGYFQSYKYFNDIEKDIKDQFIFNDEILKNIYSKYSLNFEDFCAIHLRCGDYIGKENHHPIMDKNYYQKAISIINDKKYLIFSDSTDKAKEVFSSLNGLDIIYIEDNHPFEDLCMMSLCSDNIIANSTFSWWAAWLNKNNNKKIIAPSNWLGPAYANTWNIEDIIPKNWIII
jgi:hypothetical protein